MEQLTSTKRHVKIAGHLWICPECNGGAFKKKLILKNDIVSVSTFASWQSMYLNIDHHCSHTSQQISLISWMPNEGIHTKLSLACLFNVK